MSPTLKLEKAPIKAFRSLAYGRVLDELAGPEFRDLVVAIVSKPEGCAVGLEIVSLRFYSDAAAKREPLPEVLEAARFVLGKFTFQRNTDEDHELGVVIAASLAGPEGVPVAQSLCGKFLAAATKYEIVTFKFQEFMKGLLRVQAIPTLNVLFSDDAESYKASKRIFRNFHHPIFHVVPDDVLLSWCGGNPATRFPLAAAIATLFKGESETREWMPLTRKLLEQAPDPSPVLTEILRRLHPSSWSGSLATELEGRLKLLNTLPGGEAPGLAAQMAEARTDLEARISDERKREMEEDRASNNRFE